MVLSRFALALVAAAGLVAASPRPAGAAFGGTVILINKTTSVIDYYLDDGETYDYVTSLYPGQKYVERFVPDMHFRLGADIGGEWLLEDFVVADISKNSYGGKKFKWLIKSN